MSKQCEIYEDGTEEEATERESCLLVESKWAVRASVGKYHFAYVKKNNPCFAWSTTTVTELTSFAKHFKSVQAFEWPQVLVKPFFFTKFSTKKTYKQTFMYRCLLCSPQVVDPSVVHCFSVGPLFESKASSQPCHHYSWDKMCDTYWRPRYEVGTRVALQI